jgi:hypothetical protein
VFVAVTAALCTYWPIVRATRAYECTINAQRAEQRPNDLRLGALVWAQSGLRTAAFDVGEPAGDRSCARRATG